MGFFSRKPKIKSGSNSEIESILNKADEAYIRAYETRSISVLKEYFTRDCCIRLSSVIASTASMRYFSVDSFRNTTWDIQRQSKDSMTVLKEVDYNEIRVAGTYKMKVSADYKEEWILTLTEGTWKVDKVTLIND